MDKQMYFVLSAAIGYAVATVMVLIAFLVHSMPELYPVLLLGTLGVAADFTLLLQPWHVLACVAVFMRAFLGYLAERGKHPDHNETAALDHSYPSWMRNTPSPAEAVEAMQITWRAEGYSVSWMRALPRQPGAHRANKTSTPKAITAG